MLRVGIIGTGIIANLNILGYINSPDTEVVAVADLDKKSAGKKLERWCLRIAKPYTDYKKIGDNEDIDMGSLSKELQDYVKTAKIIMGHSLYSDSWLEL